MPKISKEDLRSAVIYEAENYINVTKVLEGIINDLQNGISISKISAKFHNTVIAIITEVAVKIKNETGINKIALSGGVFQNRYILEQSENLLKQTGFQVYSQRLVPANDAGIALGQLAIAAKRRQLGCV